MGVLLIKGIERNKILLSLPSFSPSHQEEDYDDKLRTRENTSLSLPGTIFSLGSYSWHIALKTQGKTWYFSKSLWIPDGRRSYTEGKICVHRS